MEQLLLLNLGVPEIIILSIVLFPILLMTFCLVDIIRSDFKDNTMKIIWVLVVLFAPLIGSLIYLAFGRAQKVV